MHNTKESDMNDHNNDGVRFILIAIVICFTVIAVAKANAADGRDLALTMLLGGLTGLGEARANASDLPDYGLPDFEDITLDIPDDTTGSASLTLSREYERQRSLNRYRERLLDIEEERNRILREKVRRESWDRKVRLIME
jgi:hypothetical protein